MFSAKKGEAVLHTVRFYLKINQTNERDVLLHLKPLCFFYFSLTLIAFIKHLISDGSCFLLQVEEGQHRN